MDVCLSLCLGLILFTSPIVAENSCTITKSCEECISVDHPWHQAGCGWCYTRDFREPRCDYARNLYEAGCYYRIYSEENKPPEAEFNSSKCNHHGVFKCGQCECDEDRHGYACEYDGPPSGYNKSLAECINPSNKKICSDRGKCYNGSCECGPRKAPSAQRYSGKYCECDDYSCSYSDDRLCGGRGRCVCGQCVCDEGFEDDACSCPASNRSCISSNGKVCNGVGTCRCGFCNCPPYSHLKGPTCEDCPTCLTQCVPNKACAECVGFKTGLLTPDQCDKLCTHTTAVTTIDKVKALASSSINLCTFKFGECRYYFTYEYIGEHRNETQWEVKVETTLDCPESRYRAAGNQSGRSVLFVLVFSVMTACSQFTGITNL